VTHRREGGKDLIYMRGRKGEEGESKVDLLHSLGRGKGNRPFTARAEKKGRKG